MADAEISQQIADALVDVLGEPKRSEALEHAAAESRVSRDRLERALANWAVDRQEWLDDDLREKLATLRTHEVAVDAAINVAIDKRAEEKPSEFEARRQLVDLIAARERMLEEDEAMRRAVDDHRVKIAAVRARAAIDPTNDPKKAQRELNELEHDRLAKLEERRAFRARIADLITQQKVVEMTISSMEAPLRRRLVDEAPEGSPLRAAIAQRDASRADVERALRAALGQSVDELIAGPLLRAVLDLADVLDEHGSTSNEAAFGDPDAEAREAVSTIASVATDAGIEQDLQLRRRIADGKLVKDIASRRARTVIAPGIAAAVVLIPAAILATGAAQIVFGTYAALFLIGTVFLGVQLRGRASAAAEDITDAQNELDLLHIVEDHPERRAQKMLQVNQLDLKRYYDQTLRQGRLIYYLGIGCILLGFVAVGAAIGVIGTDKHHFSEQVVVAALGAVSAILANFIGVVYLRMFSDTIGSVGNFHTRLVETHDLYFGNLLASKIEDQALRQDTFAEMARDAGRQRIASGAGGPPKNRSGVDKCDHT